MDILTREITLKQVCGNNLDFLAIEITSKKVRGNNVDFSAIEITSKKVRGNNVDFSTSEITSKKYVETRWIFWSAKLHRKSTWKWRQNSSKIGLQLIDVISMSNRPSRHKTSSRHLRIVLELPYLDKTFLRHLQDVFM